MKFRPFSHPLNWYPYDVTGSLELLQAYVDDVEQQVLRQIARFESDAETVIEDEIHPDEQPRIVTVHLGLDDHTWDLQAIFREYFPNLQRRSALITLFSFLEHELNKLCLLFHSTESYRVSPRDLSGGGLERCRNYLTKVALLDLDRSPGPWMEVRQIQLLRNAFVHADGRLVENGGQGDKLRRYVEESPLLVDKGEGGEVHIREGYLRAVLQTFGRYFELVHKAIEQRYDA